MHVKTTNPSAGSSTRAAARFPASARTIVAAALVLLLGLPAAGAAQSIRESAERLAAEAVLQNDVGGPSTAKRVTSTTLMVAGIAAVLLGNPEYVPSEFIPGNYPNRVNIRDYLGDGNYPGHTYRLRHRRGTQYGFRWTCRQTACRITNTQLHENYVDGYTDGYDDGLFAGAVAGHKAGWQEGYVAGRDATIEIINAQGFVVYDGPFNPASYVKETFSDRKAIRYGGVALVAAGAVLNLVWPDSPARLSVAPLRGGGHVGATFGF